MAITVKHEEVKKIAVVNLEEARRGVEKDGYAAYIIIPANFSGSIDSLNGTPTPAILQYALNENPDKAVQTEILYQILTFEEELDTDLSYMYLANVLQEFHDAQDKTTQVMANDLKDKEAIDKIRASDLVEMVNIPELKQEENNTTPADITSHMETNSLLVAQVDEAYQTLVEDTRGRLASIGEGGADLNTALEVLSANVGEINLTTDENRHHIYESGLTALAQALQEYNNGIDSKKTDSVTQMKALETERKKLAEELDKSVEAYNSRLSTEAISYIDGYREKLKNSIPSITVTEVAESNGTSYRISCSQVPGMEMPPVVTFNLVTDRQEEKLLKQECLRMILGHMDAAALEECNRDPQLMSKLSSCGYASASNLLFDYLSEDPSFDSIAAHIETEGSIADIDAYLKAAFDTVDTAAYAFEPYTGAIIDQQGAPLTDTEGDAVTVRTRLEDYKTLIANAQSSVTDLPLLDTKQVSDIVTKDCIFPLLNRAEAVKGTLQQRYGDETAEIKDYQTILAGYDPIIDTTRIQEFVAQMKTNGSELQQSVTENNQSYAEYANRVYATTQENMITLQRHIQEVKEASDHAVVTGLAEAKAVKQTTSGDNQQAMADFAAKLPFTRLGSMEFTQSYQFIANPLRLVEVSDHQRLND